MVGTAWTATRIQIGYERKTRLNTPAFAARMLRTMESCKGNRIELTCKVPSGLVVEEATLRHAGVESG